MKDTVRDSLYFAVCNFAAVMIGTIISIIAVTPSRMISPDPTVQSTIVFIIEDIVIFAALFIIMRGVGFKLNRKDESVLPKNIIVSIIISVLPLYLIVLITNFSFYLLYSNTNMLINAIYAGKEGGLTVGIDAVQEKYWGQTFTVHTIHTLLYIIPMIGGYYFGSKKRIDERAVLTGKSN